MKNDYSQSSLFAGTEQISEILLNTDGDVRLYRYWLSPAQAEADYQALMVELQWQHSRIRIGGKSIPLPRLNAWYGEPECHYSYSGIAFNPLPWSATLARIRVRLQHELGVNFNSVLANLYRDGRDSVAWHSDNEPELGVNPVIASVSLGAERRFRLKHKTRSDLAPVTIDLPQGSMLVMAGLTQQYWLHQITKTTRSVAPRINLTFRLIDQSFDVEQAAE